jgi:hypothetical protein
MKQQRFISCLSLSSHYKLFYSGTGSDTVLKQTIMPIVDRDTCNKTEWVFFGLITPYMICGGWEEGKNDACEVHYF